MGGRRNWCRVEEVEGGGTGEGERAAARGGKGERRGGGLASKERGAEERPPRMHNLLSIQQLYIRRGTEGAKV